MTDIAQEPKPARRERPLDPVKEAQAVRALKESLAAVDAEDEALLMDSIEGQTSLFEVIDALLSRMSANRAFVEGVAVVASDLAARAARFEKRIETDRALIEQAMMIAEIEKIERPAATLSLSQRQPKVEIAEEADIPTEFWRSPDPVLDKKAIAVALKEGRPVPGACLSNAAPSLTVRTK